MMFKLENVHQLQELVLRGPRLSVRGAGTKGALSGRATASLEGLRGIVSYDPSEFTLTAMAGTPLSEIDSALRQHGQYMPFDPPLIARGATIGGTIAAGMSGPGRLRFGGVRDFLLAVQLVTGKGELVQGGAPVVKNAAGFDLPKLMVGSLGRLGIITQVTIKVFPRPAAYVTMACRFDSIEPACTAMHRLAGSCLELQCLELLSGGRLLLRIAGNLEAVSRTTRRMEELLDRQVETVADDETTWEQACEFQWLPPGHDLIKMPLAPPQCVAANQMLQDAPHRFSVAGNLCWIGWPVQRDRAQLNSILHQLRRPALAITGSWANPLIGAPEGAEFHRRLATALDPPGIFRGMEEDASSDPR